MTKTFLTLDGVSCILPDGRALFADLHETFDERATGLVGRNGTGKSVLAQVLAGRREPTLGRCVRKGRIHYLAQRVAEDADESVAALAGVNHVLAALDRIASGNSDPNDFDTVGEHWDMHDRLRDALNSVALEHVDIHAKVSALSGGEAMRVALLGARLNEADYLILDEPSNHLDGVSRAALRQWLRAWHGGLLVVSHDRELLGDMQRTVELSPSGLRSYGGNFAFYAETRRNERDAAQRTLDASRIERRRGEKALREQRERQTRRQARGRRDASDANQAPILLGGQKNRSESSAGRLRQRQDALREALSAKVSQAALGVEHNVAPALLVPSAERVTRKKVAALEHVVLPFVRGATREIDLVLAGGQRLGVTGPNGSGKSVLMQVLAGRLAPLSGEVHVSVRSAWLDQRLSTLDPMLPLIDQMRDVATSESEDSLRLRLALIGLEADKIRVPTGLLSGGERLKGALLHALIAEPPTPLLLLDEPGNHLDIASLDALETMLQHYEGTLVVVSHDEVFLDRLDLTDRLSPTAEGWRMQPW